MFEDTPWIRHLLRCLFITLKNRVVRIVKQSHHESIFFGVCKHSAIPFFNSNVSNNICC